MEAKIEEKVARNSDTKWSELYESTHQLTSANSINDVISRKEAAHLETLVKDVILNFLSAENHHVGLKIYVDQILSNEYVDEMVKRPPTAKESLEDWCTVIFGEKRFGVVFNFLEVYSNAFTEKMCEIVHPLIRKAGLPLGGLSFLFFMGNYGFTPFGIHKEAQGEEGFLFHLGPARKEFFTWDYDEYNSIEHNTQVFHNVEEMMPSATRYTLLPGSVMFIPHHLYHIANTADFSLSVVMDYINPSREKLELELAKNIGKSKLTVHLDQEYLRPIQSDDSDQVCRLVNSQSWQRRFKEALERKIKILQSNSGVLKPSVVRNLEAINGKISIQGIPVFPLLLSEIKDETFIYARGHELQFKSNSGLSRLIDQLNDGKTLDLKALEATLLPEWDLYDILNFTHRLCEVEALHWKVLTK